MPKNKKYNYIFLVALVFFSSISLYAKDIHSIKQEIWDKMSYDVDHWVDGIGYPIDKEIKEVVIALNLMGVKTIASCEGHFDHGCLYPWVDLEVSSSETEKFMVETKKKLEQIEIEEKSLEAKYPDLSYKARQDQLEAEHLLALYKERFLLSKSYEQAKMNCLEPLNILLNQFYENRNISYDRVLIIPLSSGRLQSVGADRQVIRPEEEQNFKLAEYREEMKAFAAFLKKKFMNEH